MKLPYGKTLLLISSLLFLLLSSSAIMAEEIGPDSVELDILTDLYEPVSFDHAMHVDMVEGNCARCHHHTTGLQPEYDRCLKCHKGGVEADSMICQDCHSTKRFDVDYLAAVAADHQLYHIDKPGLKGAYHQNCLGCHQEDDGPTGCQDCHARKDSGDAFFHAGDYAPADTGKSGGH